MSKLFKRFGVDETLEESGVWVDFGDGINVKIRRIKSRYVEKVRSNLEEPHTEMIRKGPLPENVAQKLAEKLVAYGIIADWRGIEDENGNTMQPTDENKLIIVKALPEFREEILKVSVEQANYRKRKDEDAEKNFLTPSDGA